MRQARCPARLLAIHKGGSCAAVPAAKSGPDATGLLPLAFPGETPAVEGSVFRSTAPIVGGALETRGASAAATQTPSGSDFRITTTEGRSDLRATMAEASDGAPQATVHPASSDWRTENCGEHIPACGP